MEKLMRKGHGVNCLETRTVNSILPRILFFWRLGSVLIFKSKENSDTHRKKDFCGPHYLSMKQTDDMSQLLKDDQKILKSR
jgi:hypothetical protein